MLKKVRKYMFLISCMLFGMFLLNNTDVLANDAVLLDSSSVFVGEENKDNKYYFSNSTVWEFRVDGYQVWNPLQADTFLKWRVIRPDGMATTWSDKDYYVDKNGKFTIENYTTLSYTEEMLYLRDSVAPVSTYHVEIQYYSHFIWDTHLKDKDETLKIVIGGTDEDLYRPAISVVYDETAGTFKVNAEMLRNGIGTGIITKLSYFFSDVKIEDVKNSQFVNTSTIQVNNKVETSVNMEENTEYLYVLAESGNGYSTVLEFEIPTEDSKDESNTTGTGSTGGDKSTGLFDYEFGEIILIVLIIVLIVSCALIITQKIVDYKKRLY